MHADSWKYNAAANLHDCETNKIHFSLSPLDIISTVVTQFLSPAIGNDSNWALCWQTSAHGWAVSTFHSRCDGKKHTITVIRKEPYVSEDTPIFLGVSEFFAGGGTIKGTESAKLILNP